MTTNPPQGAALQASDPGLAVLVLIARFHGIAADAAQLQHSAGISSGTFSDRDLALAARSLGLKARSVRVNAQRLAKTPFPALVLDQAGQHFALAGCDGDKALVMEAGAAAPSVCSPAEVMERSDGRMLLFASRASLAGASTGRGSSRRASSIVACCSKCSWSRPCCNCSAWSRR
jgi:subfamily B ATP-binding cassette protein HlyB/CyaB